MLKESSCFTNVNIIHKDVRKKAITLQVMRLSQQKYEHIGLRMCSQGILVSSLNVASCASKPNTMEIYCFRDDIPSHKIKEGILGGWRRGGRERNYSSVILEKHSIIHSPNCRLCLLYYLCEMTLAPLQVSGCTQLQLIFFLVWNYSMLELSPPSIYKIKLKHHVIARGSTHILR